MHFINSEGRLVCTCELDPNECDVYPVWNVKQEHRWLFCPDSLEYLRKLVRRLQQKEMEKAHE